jgi:predicted nuclease with RNAse H fold
LATKNYFGLDLTSGEQKPSACVSIDDNLRIIKTALISGDSDIISLIKELQPAVIAIDAPLSLPEGLCCLNEKCPCKTAHEYKGRRSERMLAKIRIPCYFTTKQSIIKDMVMRAIEFRRQLEKQGFTVIEVYPYASKRRLFGQLKPKTTSAGIRQLREAISKLLQADTVLIEKWNHDLCDAAIAAYTGLLYISGDTEKLGNDIEGYIFIPDNNCGQETNG